MTGVDPTDPVTGTSTGHVFTDYTQFLDKNALKGARIGVWRQGNFGLSPETDTIMEATIARLAALGATIVDPADIPIEPAYDPEFTALLYEFKHDLDAYLGALPAEPAELAPGRHRLQQRPPEARNSSGSARRSWRSPSRWAR